MLPVQHAYAVAGRWIAKLWIGPAGQADLRSLPLSDEELEESEELELLDPSEEELSVPDEPPLLSEELEDEPSDVLLDPEPPLRLEEA